MQCSFGTSPRGNDETVCLVYAFKSHVPDKEDDRNVGIQHWSASHASEPSLQTRTSTNQGLHSANLILAMANDFFHAVACAAVSSRTTSWSC